MEIYSIQDLYPIFEDMHSKVSLSSDKYLKQNRIARTIWLCTRMDGEIKNGGVAQLFFNLRGGFDFELFEDAFRIIGSKVGAEIVSEFNHYLAESEKRKERFFSEAFFGKGMTQKTYKLHDKLSMQYYKDATDVETLIIDYATENWENKDFQEAIKHINFKTEVKDESELIYDLTSAIEGANIKVIKKLAPKISNLNQADQYSNVPFVEIGRRGMKGHKKRIEMCQILLDNGADIHAMNKYGDTLLHKLAADKGNLEVIQFLLDQGVDVNYAPNQEECALAQAHGALENAKLLLEHGANINQRSYLNVSPLGRALTSYGGWIGNKHKKEYQPEIKKVIKFLLENGAEFYDDWILMNKMPELYHIVGDPAYLKTILQYEGVKNAPEFNPNYTAWNALFEASKTGNDKSLKLFIEAGAAIKQTLVEAKFKFKSFAGANLLSFAKNKKVEKLLLDQGLEKVEQISFSVFLETRGREEEILAIIKREHNCSLEEAKEKWLRVKKVSDQSFEKVGDKYVQYFELLIKAFPTKEEAQVLVDELKAAKSIASYI